MSLRTTGFFQEQNRLLDVVAILLGAGEKGSCPLKMVPGENVLGLFICQ